MAIQHILILITLIGLSPVVNGAFSSSFFHGKATFSRARASNRHGPFFADKEIIGSSSGDSRTQEDEKEKTAVEIEAEELRQRAKQLLAEARAMEARLGDTRLDTVKQRHQESDALIESLFMRNTTRVELSKRLVDERWSPDQLTLVIERLHERQVQALGRSAGRSSAGFQIGDTSNRAEPDEEEWNRLDAQIECLLEAAAILDDDSNNANDNRRWTGRVSGSLRSRLKELRRTDEQEFQRKLAASVNALANTNVSVQEFVRGTLGTALDVENNSTTAKSMNISLIMERVALVPMWIPSSLLPFLIISRSKIDQEDIKTIRDNVLTAGTGFYLTSSESIPGAAVFRGNIRTPLGIVNTTMERNQTAVVFEEIQTRLTATGLSDRIQLFFWNDPEWRPGRDDREPTPQPVILALPAEIVPEQGSEAGYASLALKTLSISTTLLATIAYSISCYALNPAFYNSIVERSDISALIACLPICIGVLAVQAIHEAAQYFVAKKRSRIRIGLPVLLPSFQIGTFGSIMPLRSFPRNRAALLDFALSGPLAGFAISILLLAGGTLATVYASSNALVQFPVVPVSLLKASYFVGSMLSFLAPKTMILPSSQPVPVHPLFMIGFAGLISNALNMLPIGRLDGGRAYTAVFGSRNASIASTLTLAFMALLSLTGMSNIAIFWGALVVLFQRHPEIPVRDEVTEVDDTRVGVYVGLLALTIMALSPYPTGQGML